MYIIKASGKKIKLISNFWKKRKKSQDTTIEFNNLYFCDNSTKEYSDIGFKNFNENNHIKFFKTKENAKNAFLKYCKDCNYIEKEKYIKMVQENQLGGYIYENFDKVDIVEILEKEAEHLI